ncbi:hypothetical protein BV379_04850 [Rhodovulum sulfidophilum]|nr:hypothetical protein BV379_04850 [Rhodovulum sulfidophilum]
MIGPDEILPLQCLLPLQVMPQLFALGALYLLLNFGTADGEVSDTDIAALRDYLGSAEAADAQRGPLLVETIPDPAAAQQVADLERQILSDLRVFASRMETVIQPWIDDWERSGWFGALGTFLGGLRDGAAAWVDGESEFWAGMWEWVSGLPDMLGEAWDDLSAGVRALWDNRHRIVELLQSLAEGAVDAFERGFAALLDALDGLPGIEEIVELLRSLVIRSAEWAGAMYDHGPVAWRCCRTLGRQDSPLESGSLRGFS